MSGTVDLGPADQPEYLTSGSPASPGRGRRWPIFAGAGVILAGAAGLGVWAVASFLSGGPSAATALPDSVLAYASINLDPSASQKIEAVKTFNKFPGLADELKIGSRDDLRRRVFEEVQKAGDCQGLDYGADIEPWLGDQAAVAALPGDAHPDVLVAFAVKDPAQARAGVAKVFAACGGGDFGTAFVGDFMLVAETPAIAREAAADAETSPLSNDADYQQAVAGVGDLGIVTAYVAPDAPKAVVALEGASAKVPDGFADFDGAALTVRFSEGGFELAAAATGLPGSLDSTAGPTTIGDLPDSTVAALGLALPDGWGDDLLDNLRSSLGHKTADSIVGDAEQQTGLTLPDDLETLLGDSAVLALDGRTDPADVTGDPTDVKAGIRVDGDDTAIRGVLDPLLQRLGPLGEDAVEVRSGIGRVAVGLDGDYTDDLLAGGDLGDTDRFQKAVANPDQAQAVLFVDFDTQDHWLDRLATSLGADHSVLENLEPLSAVGLSSWADGDTTHLVVRLATE